MFRKHSPPLADRIFRGVGHLMFLFGGTWARGDGVTGGMPNTDARGIAGFIANNPKPTGGDNDT